MVIKDNHCVTERSLTSLLFSVSPKSNKTNNAMYGKTRVQLNCRIWNRQFLASVFFSLFLWVILLSTYNINAGQSFSKDNKKMNGSVEDITISTSDILERELPYCVTNVLNNGAYPKTNWVAELFIRDHLITKNQYSRPCRLLKYTVANAVTCFDTLYQKQITRNSFTPNKKLGRFSMLHFVFMGDSRIRQQYFNFLQLIPDYDRQTNPIQIKRNEQSFKHDDIDVYSTILKLRISYKWLPLINDTAKEIIEQYIASDEINRPLIVLLSMEVHHMLQKNYEDFNCYKQRLLDFGAVLGKLAHFSKVIWLNQYPIVEFYGPSNAHNTDIHTEKVHHYNEAVRLIFKQFRKVYVWDSSNQWAEEYIRSCSVFPEREMHHPFFEKEGKPFHPISCKPYMSCLDFIHTGYAALSEATQLLYNDICNYVLNDSQ